MNSKKTLTLVGSVVVALGVAVAGWFTWDKTHNGGSLVSQIVATKVDFTGAYVTLVDGFTKDYVDMMNKVKDFKNLQETLTLNADGGYDQFKGNLSLNMSGLYTNQGRVIDNKGLFDFGFNGNASFPNMQSSTGQVENLTFSGSFVFQMLNGKMLANLKSLAVNSPNPQIMMIGGFAKYYENKWILIMDYLNMTGVDNPAVLNNLNTTQIYDLINQLAQGLKTYPVISQTGVATQEGDYAVYKTQLNKQNIMELYKIFLNSSLVSSMTGTSGQQLQDSINELSGTLANSNLGGTFKVKDSENMVYEFDAISGSDVLFTGKVYKLAGKLGADFVFTNPSQSGTNIVISLQKLNGFTLNLVMNDSGTKLGEVNGNAKIDINGNSITSNLNVNGTIEKANFNVKVVENTQSINEIQSGAIVMPEKYTELKDLAPF